MAIVDHIDTVSVKCLDFGSGPEPVLAELLKREFDWSVDIYDKFYATDRVYEGNIYDLITSTEVAEHLDDPLHYFRLFKELLHQNGVLSIMTLFHPSSIEDFTNWFYINDRSHISFYTPKTMKVIADIVGLDVLYCDENRYITFSHACPP
ncbi:MAG: class I SAM-dependent methyltransferase [Bacillota bacterium]|nr:class I SAM-dependent methyltransferase [Bacillota bacterium]